MRVSNIERGRSFNKRIGRKVRWVMNVGKKLARTENGMWRNKHLISEVSLPKSLDKSEAE